MWRLLMSVCLSRQSYAIVEVASWGKVPFRQGQMPPAFYFNHWGGNSPRFFCGFTILWNLGWSMQIILNADDFGRSSAINRAVMLAHREGVLTSASLMVSGDAFEEAVALARATLALEMNAQFERFAATGLPLSHVDGHLHMHLHPTVFRLLLPLAEKYGARGLRVTRDDLRLALRYDRGRVVTKVMWAIVV